MSNFGSSTGVSTRAITGAFKSPGTTKCIFARVSSTECPSLDQQLGYILGKTLGSGTYAKVKAAWSKRHQSLVAIKILNKSVASRDYLHKFLPREIDILQKINHSSIIRVLEIIETDKLAYFMMELAQNGDLLDYINARRTLPEAEAKYLFRQLVLGIQYLHRHNIVHRDLKCENIMLSKDMEVKIGDFGFSLNLSTAPSKTPCGSYSYAAPELFQSSGEPYDGRKSDAWSLGVILFAMTCGRLPFGDDSQVKAQQKLGLIFPPSRPLSHDAKDLLRNILSPKVKDRFDTYDMILHDWTASLPVRVPPPLSSKPKYTLEECIPTIRGDPILPHMTRPPTPVPLPLDPGQPSGGAHYAHQARPHRHARHGTAAPASMRPSDHSNHSAAPAQLPSAITNPLQQTGTSSSHNHHGTRIGSTSTYKTDQQ